MTDLPDELRDHDLTYRVLAMPADTNAHGDIFGGWLMAQVDIAGSILAVQEAQGRVATVAVSAFRFVAPVKVGDLVSCYSRITKTGITSVTVEIQVMAARDRDPEHLHHVAEATLVYVAMDAKGNPRSVRQPLSTSGTSS